MENIIKKMGKLFRLPGELHSFEVIKNGNINSTYKCTFENEGRLKSYVFQRINTNVFKNPVEIMKNIDMVTTHIRDRYKDVPTLHFHHTAEGANYVLDEDDSFWRVMNYIDSVTYNTCDDLEVIRETGEAFGRFQMQLSDFDGSCLYETIPDFHNTKKRLDTFFSDVSADKAGRVAAVSEEIEYMRGARAKAAELSVRFAEGDIPVRVTHNDTKANNVLFDRNTNKPLIVIDLDTVMPGMAAYDFGDAARFIANTAGEDEADLSKVSFDTEKFRALCEGFLSQVAGSITADEIRSLVLATYSVTVELASRFLDDYVNGDTYFKICYPEHNLVRARCQIHLAKSIMSKFDELNAVVEELLEKYN